jgi:dihydroorotate dehydrogenase electron transfer subunit
MPINLFTELIGKEELIPGIFKFGIKAKEITDIAKPGQFLEIRVTDQTEPFLRRPISIYNIDKEKNLLEFIFQVKGKGTEILAKKNIGDTIDVIGPIGYGDFKYQEYKDITIIGGGIGVFPLYELAKRAKENSHINIYLGFRNKDFVVLENEFKAVSDKLEITTDDGSYGKKGLAIELLKEDVLKKKPDCIYACGPLPMLRAVREFAIQNNICCQISLEEKMGCGLGACLGCAVKVISGQEPRFGHVCKEGPVFEAKDVEI